MRARIANSDGLASKKAWLLSLFICVAVASGSLWKLHEDDIFWQIRSGEDIVQARSVPDKDAWSYTIKGQPWVNYQWASHVLIYGLYKLGGPNLLIASRAGVIFLWFLLIAGLIHVLPLTSRSKGLSALTIIPLAYVACQSRLQLRPETFTLVIFTAQYCLLLSGKYSNTWQAMLVLIAAQLHGGTAVFNLFLACVYSLFSGCADLESFSRDLKRKLGWVLVYCACFLCTPVHFKIIPQIIFHSKYDTNLIFNLEWIGFSSALLSPSRQGWTFFVAYSMILAWVVFFPYDKKRMSFFIEKGLEPLLFFFLTITMVWLSYKYVRMIPYAVICAAPFWAMLIDRHFNRIENRNQKAAAALMLCASCGLLWIQVERYANRLGFGLDSEEMPVNAFEFIRKSRPKPRMFSAMPSGSYAVWNAREYEDFMDDRDVLFDSVKLKYRRAHQNAETMQNLMNEYKVNFVVYNYGPGEVSPEGNIFNPIGQLFLKELWALVYFTNKEAVIVRRIPEHKEIIGRYEYKEINPCLPPMLFALTEGMDGARRARIESEHHRCLREEPANIFCRNIAVAKLIHQQTRGAALEALKILQEIKSYGLTSWLDINHYSLEWQAYQIVGDRRKVLELERILSDAARH